MCVAIDKRSWWSKRAGDVAALLVFVGIVVLCVGLWPWFDNRTPAMPWVYSGIAIMVFGFAVDRIARFSGLFDSKVKKQANSLKLSDILPHTW